MGLFNSIEIDPNVIPYIQKGEGVGIVKVDGMGKCSAKLENNAIILDPYESPQQSQIIPLEEINFLSYDEGNFINEPKFNIGTSGKHYVLAGVDDNDDELKRFYNTILNIKENSRIPKYQNGVPQPNTHVTNPNKQPQLQHNNMDFNPSVNNSTEQSQPHLLNNDDVIDGQDKMDPVAEIRRYFELKEDGIITEEEFTKKKKQLLGL